MRGRSIVGVISEGDEVEVFGKEEDGLIHAKQIQNLTTVAAVKAKGIPTAIKVFTAIGIVIFVLFMTFIVLLILGVFQIGPH